MSIFENAIKLIESNRFNKDNCIPFSLPRFSEYIPGIQKKRYYIISGSSGSGKSQLTDHLFVFNPINFIEKNETNIKIKTYYYSLELDKETKMTQWMSRRLYDEYRIRTDINILQSVGKNRLNDETYMAVMETREYFYRLEEHVKIIDNVFDVHSIKREVLSYIEKSGKCTYSRKDEGEHEIEVLDKYVQNNENEYYQIIVDHYSLLNVPPGGNIKSTIESLSSFFVRIRNAYRCIPIAIQQQSAAKENVEHFKSDKMEPSKDGLAETKLTYNDCDIAFGIFSPAKHEIKKYRGYDVLQMKDAYRNLNVFKNRFGNPFINVGLYFDGAVGYFKELPKSEEMTPEMYNLISERRIKP